MMDAHTPGTVPADLVATIEAQTRQRAVSIVSRAGGGASRQGAEIVLESEDGARQSGYLSFDTRLGDPERIACFGRETAILKALSGPLADAGVRAPRFLAADPNHLALLTALVPGSDRYREEGGSQVGLDFIRQLAALHRIDPARADLPGFGDPARPVSDIVRQGLDTARTRNLATAPHPVLLLAIRWLQDNIPPDRGPAVIVHGDAGPGNFLQADGRVSALLDWELCHLGDPAEDLAAIWVRTLFQPFLSPRSYLDAYAQASGQQVDIDRVRYFRLYFQVGISVSAAAALLGDTGLRPASIGLSLLFFTTHLRVIVQSLAELTGQTLAPVVPPDTRTSWRDRTYAMALDDIRDIIAPRATDQRAAATAKSLARMIKYWRARDQLGAACDAAERTDMGAALGQTFASVEAAREALAHAIDEGRIGHEAALRLCHAMVMHETALMADGSGRFNDTYFPSID